MEVELDEILNFYSSHIPFSYLNQETLRLLPNATVIKYYRRGKNIVYFANKSNQDPNNTQYGNSVTDSALSNELLIVRSGALDVFDSENQLIEKLGEGDSYLVNNLDNDVLRANHQVVASEDTLLYILQNEIALRLVKKNPFFKTYYQGTLSHKNFGFQLPVADPPAMDFGVSLGKLMTKNPVCVNADYSVLDAVDIMNEHGISSILVTDNKNLVGILTDKDLRKRYIGQRMGPDAIVASVMTKEPITVRSNSPLINAMSLMTNKGIHHLPVMGKNKIKGIITSTDLIRNQSNNPVYLIRSVRKANDVESLSKISKNIPKLQIKLVNANVSAKDAGEIVSSITDTITSRLIQLFETENGSAPISYCWLAGGSQARGEQSSHSDQDNALIIANDYSDEHVVYFEKMANYVCDGLNSCGYVYCPGEAMASNPKWRQPYNVWHQYFHKWITQPEPKSLMLLSIFFDLRPVYGNEELFSTLHRYVLKQSKKNKIFLAHIAKNALQNEAPLGFFRKFVVSSNGEHKNTIDLKHHGTLPIADVARYYALANGLDAVNTIERIEAAMENKSISKELGRNLIDAWEFISNLRIRHQAQQLKQGIDADNYLPPDSLSRLEQRYLEEAFKIIKSTQEYLSNRFAAMM